MYQWTLPWIKKKKKRSVIAKSLQKFPLKASGIKQKKGHRKREERSFMDTLHILFNRVHGKTLAHLRLPNPASPSSILLTTTRLQFMAKLLSQTPTSNTIDEVPASWKYSGYSHTPRKNLSSAELFCASKYWLFSHVHQEGGIIFMFTRCSGPSSTNKYPA